MSQYVYLQYYKQSIIHTRIESAAWHHANPTDHRVALSRRMPRPSWLE